MDAKFEKWYDKKVQKINKLREQLLRDPENEKVQLDIEYEEKLLFSFVVNSGKELEQLIMRNQEESPYDDE